MRPPEGVGIERRLQFFERAVIRRALHVAREHSDGPAFDGGKNDFFRVHEQKPLLGLHQDFHGRRRPGRPELAHELFQPLRRACLGLHDPPRPLNRLGNSALVERLQHVVHGVHFERLHRVVIERRREHHVRDFHFPFDKLLEHAETVEAGHLHVQKHQVRRVLLDQRHGFHAVFSLPDQIDFGKTFQQKRQLIPRRLFVIHNNGVDGHVASQTAAEVALDLINITPCPRLTRLDGTDDRMFGLVEVLCRMLVLRGIAAAHVSALHAQPEMHPSVADLDAVLADMHVRALEFDLLPMRATCCHDALSRGSRSRLG